MRKLTLTKSEIEQLARELRISLAGTNLPRPLAKLYSQYTKLRSGQPGLQNWQSDETSERLNDAMSLLEAAFVERDSGTDSWRESTQRAGAILEWLSHPQLNTEELPLRLLAAAAYQIAGYPALSSGLLSEITTESTDSQILHFLLKAEFPRLFEKLVEYWANNIELVNQARLNIDAMPKVV